MMSRLGLIPLLLALAGCGDFPRDPHGTLDRIRAERQFEVELVVGRFEAKSPWSKMVSFSPPLAREKQGKTEFMLAAAMRNGENGWIALVEKAARDVAPEAQ